MISILKEKRLEKNMTLEEVGNLVGVGKSTVRKWENGMIENMGRDKIVSLSKALNISPLEILGIGTENLAHVTTTLSLINDTSAKLTENRQKTVLTTAEKELAEQIIRAKITSMEEYKASREKVNKALEEFSEEPMVDVNIAAEASAGYGIMNYCKDQILKIVTMKESDVPNSYDLAFEIKGNSMSPVYQEGDIVFVRYDSNVYNGSIMIVEVDGEAFLKKLYVKGNRLCLISLNDDVDENGNPLYPDICAGGDDEIYIIGKVVN